MSKLIKRIIIYISIIILAFLWLLFGKDYCNFGGTGDGHNCGLVFLKSGIILLAFIVLVFELLLFGVKWVYKKQKILGVLLAILIIIFLAGGIVTKFIFPTIEESKINNNQETEAREKFNILTKALEAYSKENNGRYPVENSSCTIGKDCFELEKLILPYLNNFSVNKDLIYYQSFDGSDYTLKNGIGLKYGYSSKLDRFVEDYFLFRGRHTESECFSISGASSIIGGPFGVCNLSKGSIFPQGWTASQFYTKFSPEGY